MELLVVVLTLVATVYAVVPRNRQLDLQLRLRSFDVIVVCLGSLAVLYLEFFDFSYAHGWFVHSQTWPQGITPQNTIYLVILGVAVLIALRLRFAHLTAGNIHRFRDLVLELYWNEDYAELFMLVQRRLEEFVRIYKSDFWSARFRARLSASRALAIDDLQGLFSDMGHLVKDKQSRHFLPDWAFRSRWLNRLFLSAMPDPAHSKATAQELFRAVFLSDRFVSALAKTRPYLGLALIQAVETSFDRYDFFELYLKNLLREPQSVLYTELKNNDAMRVSDRYDIPESNRLLHYLFADITTAQDLKAYKPVGDFIEFYLDDLARDRINDPYNQVMLGNYEEVGIWQSPIFAGVRFFDIMVREALFQGVEWHMWLYYMPPVVERICRNYELCDPMVDESKEFPIKYSFLLYQIFANMRDWVLALEHLPENQPNVVLRSSTSQNENNNIPKSSLIALCDSAYFVLTSEHIGGRLQRTLVNMICELYFDIRSWSKHAAYAGAFLNILRDCGRYREHHEHYRHALLAVFSQEKHEYEVTHPHKHVEELEAALRHNL